MAYNNYFPVGYQPAQIYPQGYPQYQQMQQAAMPAYQPPQNTMPSPQSNGANGIVWVQGEAAAKAYVVESGHSAMLMDSENSTFYIKSTDASGMPLPLRIFDYTERTVASPAIPVQSAPSKNPEEDYVTRKEFEERLSGLMHEQGIAGEDRKEVGRVGEQSTIQLA